MVAAGAPILVAGAAMFGARRSGRGDARAAGRAAGARSVARRDAPSSHAPRVRVRYAETDQMGVVYYANYFVWFEVARTDLLRRSAGPTARWKPTGVMLPVIEAHCEYRRPARYDDEIEVRTEGRLLSPVRMEFSLRGHAQGRRPTSRRPAAPCTPPSTGTGGRAGCPTAFAEAVRMKALVTGAAGFIGSHSAERAARPTAPTSSGIDCFTDYYPRPIKERNLAAAPRAAALPVRRGGAADADLDALLDGVTHVFHLAAQAGVRKSWGRDFDVYTTQQHRRDAAAARGASRTRRSSGSSTPRARRSTATTSPMPMREDALPQPVSPYGVTKLAAEHSATCITSTTACRPSRCATSPSTARGSGRTWASTASCAAALTGQPIALYGDGEQTRDFTFVADTVAATMAAGDRGRPGRRL